MFGSSQEVATELEEVVDLTMTGEEPLGMSRGLEPLHLSFSSPCRLVRDLHQLDPAVPPLVAIDHEGGRVHRLSAPFTHFPAAATVAKHGLTTVRAVASSFPRTRSPC